jgi:hypothetical protein
VRGSDFRCCHDCLRQEFSGGDPLNKPLRYVGTRTNSTSGYVFALTVANQLGGFVVNQESTNIRL